MNPEKDYYSILSLSVSATTEAINASYFKLRTEAINYLPQSSDSNPDELMRQQFPEVWEAYQVLSQPDLRRQYDFARQSLRKKSTGVNARYTRFRDRDKPVLVINPASGKRIAATIMVALSLLFSIVYFISCVYLTQPSLHRSGLSEFLRRYGSNLFEFTLTLMLLNLGVAIVFFLGGWRTQRFAHRRELAAGFDAFYIKYRNGEEERITKVSQYYYFFTRCIWMNIYTENGRRYSFFFPLSSLYEFKKTPDEVELLCHNSNVEYRYRRFWFFNALSEGALPLQAPITLLQHWFGVLMLGYLLGVIVIVSLTIDSLLLPGFDAGIFNNGYWLLLYFSNALVIEIFRRFLNWLNLKMVK